MIFTKKMIDNKFQVRVYGHEYLIDREEAGRLIETGQAFYKANKPVRSLKELQAHSTAA